MTLATDIDCTTDTCQAVLIWFFRPDVKCCSYTVAFGTVTFDADMPQRQRPMYDTGKQSLIPMWPETAALGEN